MRAHSVERARLASLAALISLLVACGKESMVAASIGVSSQAFSSGGSIPARYTCDGADVSPPLSWTGVPGGAHSLALTVIDPDGPGKPFVHWVIFNLPPASSDLSEGAAPPGDNGSVDCMTKRTWIGAAVLAAGSAVATYFLDPDNGKARRIRVVERSGHLVRVTARRLARESRYGFHTLVARARHLVGRERPEFADDRTLLDVSKASSSATARSRTDA